MNSGPINRIDEEWKQASMIFLEMIRSTVFVAYIVAGNNIKTLRRLADAINMSNSLLTFARLSRLVLSCISVGFGIADGLPTASSQLFGRLRRESRWIKPRELLLCELNGTRLCYALHRDGVVESLRARNRPGVFSNRSHSIDRFKWIEPIALTALYLIKMNLSFKNNCLRNESNQLKLSSLRLANRMEWPRFNAFVSRSLEDWLLNPGDPGLEFRSRNLAFCSKVLLEDIPGLTFPHDEILELCIHHEIQTTIDIILEGSRFYTSINEIPPLSEGNHNVQISRKSVEEYAPNSSGFYLTRLCNPDLTPRLIRMFFQQDIQDYLTRSGTPDFYSLTSVVSSHLISQSISWAPFSALAFHPADHKSMDTDEDYENSLGNSDYDDGIAEDMSSDEEHLPGSTAWPLTRSHSFLMTHLVKLSRSALRFVLLRERYVWAARPHPILATVNTELSRIYLQSGLLPSTSCHNLVIQITEVLENLISQSGVAHLVYNPELSRDVWVRRNDRQWDWRVILKIISYILTTASSSAAKCAPLRIFISAIFDHYSTTRLGVADYPGKSALKRKVDNLPNEENFSFPGICASLLVIMAMTYLKSELSQDCGLLIIIQSAIDIIGHSLISELTHLVNSTVYEAASFNDIAGNLHHYINCPDLTNTDPNRLNTVLKLFKRFAERVDIIPPRDIRRIVCMLSPHLWYSHLEILLALLTSSDPLRAYIVVNTVNFYKSPNEFDESSVPSGDWGISEADFQERLLEALIILRQRTDEEVQSFHRKIICNRIQSTMMRNLAYNARQDLKSPENSKSQLSDTSRHFKNTMLLSVIDPLIQLISPLSNPEVLQRIMSRCGSYGNTFESLWLNAPWPLRPAILATLDRYPPDQVVPLLLYWLSTFPSEWLPDDRPPTICAETFSMTAPVCAERMTSGCISRVRYHLLLIPADLELADDTSKKPTICKVASNHKAKTNVAEEYHNCPDLIFQLRKRRLKDIPKHIWSTTDFVDVPATFAPMFLNLSVNNQEPLLIPFTVRPLATTPDVIMDLNAAVKPYNFLKEHQLWASPRRPELGALLSEGISTGQDIGVSYLLRWLRDSPQIKENTKSGWGENTPNWLQKATEWATAVAILEDPVNLSELSKEAQISCCVNLQTYVHHGDHENKNQSLEVHINIFGELDDTPAWQSVKVHELLHRLAITCSMDGTYVCRDNASQYSWILGKQGNDVQLLAVSSIIRIVCMSDTKDQMYIKSRINTLSRRHSKNSKNVATPRKLSSIIDRFIRGNGRTISGDSFGLTNTNYNTFGWSQRQTLLGQIAHSKIGAKIITQDLRELSTKPHLLRCPAIVTRLLGMAVELGGTWNSSTATLTILNQSLRCLTVPPNTAASLALAFLGDPKCGIAEPVSKCPRLLKIGSFAPTTGTSNRER